MKQLRKLKPALFISTLLAALFMGSLLLLGQRAQAAGPIDQEEKPVIAPAFQQELCSCTPGSVVTCDDFKTADEADACFDKCKEAVGYDFYGLDPNTNGRVCENTAYSIEPETSAGKPKDFIPLPEEIPGSNNLIANGNFEYGYYQVPELGFEPPHEGNVPKGWGWFAAPVYGKVTIENNERFGLICKDDLGLEQAVEELDDGGGIFGPVPDAPLRTPNNSLSFHIQSADENDMRLGVYQTVEVVPGRDYRFSMSGTIQVQSGGGTLQPNDPEVPREAQNHTIEVSFDQSGGTDWANVPLHDRHNVQFKEEKLEFKVSEDDEDIAIIQDYQTIIKPKSNKVTIFITGWRKWANWRTAIFTIDCISLEQVVPDNTGPAPINDGAEPVAISQPAVSPPANAESTQAQIIPPSGGILEKAGNSFLFVSVAVVTVLGLIGAGIWNMRRQ